MTTLLLIVPLSVEMTVMIRRSTSHIRRTRATKEVTSPTKRSPMVKLTSGKNGSAKMRAPTPIIMLWQPWLSREILIQASLFPKLNQEKHTCLLAKKNKHKVKTKGISSPKYASSDDNDDSNYDDAPFPNGLNEKEL
jgi:hypothetical protein